MSQHAVELLIGGESVAASTSTDVLDPTGNGRVVGLVPVAERSHVDRAVAAAGEAATRWAGTPPEDRARALSLAAESILAEVDPLARLLCAEHGKPVGEARQEVAATADLMVWHSQQPEVLHPATSSSARGRETRRRVPMGVVAVIVPWNYPVLLAHLMVAPALLAGNVVVVKLPDHSPLALHRTLVLLADQLPPGVLNVLAGTGDVVGAGLTTHPLVRKVAFTGSTSTGRAIMAAAAGTLKSISLELGGNDAAVLLPDFELSDEVVDELLQGCLTNAGQVCYAPKRLYVPRDRVEELCHAITRRAAGLRLGLPDAEGVAVGPVNNAQQRRDLDALLENAVAGGARAVPLGSVDPDLPAAGHWVRPHLVVGIDDDAALVQQEQFGPLVPLVAYDDVDDAVRMANRSEYGLAASVWSGDPERAFAVAGRLEAGTVFVNIHRVGASAVDMPFGGMKQSGIGRGHAVEGILEYTELQVLAERNDIRTR